MTQVHVYKTRALNIVQHLLNCSGKQARSFIQRSVLSLTPEDFAHTIELPNGQAHDVYGKVIADEGWYLKIEININDHQPGIVSCHPAEHDLRTRRGMIPRGRRSE